MIDKLCVCGHAMEDRGAQTLEMNGSSLGSNLWTDHVEVDVYICPWCGRMAFFEPEAIQPVLSSTLDCGIANVGVLLKLFFQSSHFEVVIPFPSKTEDWAENRDSLSEFNSGSFSVM